ncbi:hypothetical protein V8F20_005499 [Naviculisporaceae sp. PSN 640]
MILILGKARRLAVRSRIKCAPIFYRVVLLMRGGWQYIWSESISPGLQVSWRVVPDRQLEFRYPPGRFQQPIFVLDPLVMVVFLVFLLRCLFTNRFGPFALVGLHRDNKAGLVHWLGWTEQRGCGGARGC